MKLVLVQPQLSLAENGDNLGLIQARLAAAHVECERDDIVLLPEGVDRSNVPEDYERRVCGLARALGCHVVGGSHRERIAGGAVNAGLVCDADGNVIGRYEKLRPYGGEREFVQPGTRLGEFVIGGRSVLVLICADFWFTDLVQRATRLPELILVAALSVTRKPTPDYARTLWHHIAVARAYEFGAYIGISDWGHPSELPVLIASGVGGFADPTATAPERLFSPIGEAGVAVHRLDFDALEDFRKDRRARGFFATPRADLPGVIADGRSPFLKGHAGA